MNLKNIFEILNNKSLPDNVKEKLVIGVLAEDENIIPMLLGILGREREVKSELINDFNLELSRSLVTIEDKGFGKKKPIIERSFVIQEIRKFYLKWQSNIRCCFNMDGLP